MVDEFGVALADVTPAALSTTAAAIEAGIIEAPIQAMEVLYGTSSALEAGGMSVSQAYAAIAPYLPYVGAALAAVSIGFTLAGDMPDELKALYTAADTASAVMLFIPGAQFFAWAPQVVKLFGLLGGGESGRERNIAAREAQDIALSQNIAVQWHGILPLGTITAANIRNHVALLQDLSGILKGRGIGQDPKLAILGASQLGRDLVIQLDALIGAGPFTVNFPRGGGLDSHVAAALSWHLGESPYIGSPNDAPMLLTTLLYALSDISGIPPITPKRIPLTPMSPAWLATYPAAQTVEELAFQQTHGTAARSQAEWDLLTGVVPAASVVTEPAPVQYPNIAPIASPIPTEAFHAGTYGRISANPTEQAYQLQYGTAARSQQEWEWLQARCDADGNNCQAFPYP